MRPSVRRTALAGLLALAGALLTLPASADQPASRAPAARAAAPSVPAGCRPTLNPPPTEYGFVARIEDGSIEAGDLAIESMDVSICGVLRLVASPAGSSCPVSTQLRVPADGVKVNAIKAVLRIIPGKPLEVPVTLRAQPTASTVSCEGDSADGLKVALRLTLDGRAGLFGLQCALPFRGVAAAVVTGDLLSPPYEGTARLTGDDFTVDKVANHDKYCPGELPNRIGRLVRLPVRNVPVDLKAKIAVYQGQP